MAKRKRPRVPSYRLHRPSGLAVVRLNGRDIYLGKHGSPESRRLYDRTIAEWLASGRQPPVADPDDLRIAELAARFWSDLEAKRRGPDGKLDSEAENYRAVLGLLDGLYGDEPANAFTAAKLAVVRSGMIERGWTRKSVNKQTSRLRRVFRYGLQHGLVEATVVESLRALDPLRPGDGGVKEGEPVRPVPEAHVEAVRPHVSRQVWAIVQLQLMTAARPSEVCALRPVDLDTSGDVWMARPERHKTAHHGKDRVILLGPRAQEVVKPFLMGRPIHAPLFSPKEAEAERLAELHARRKTPLSCGNRPGSNRRTRPRKQPGDAYTVAAYRRAIARACKAAGVPRWHPYQLRHNAATLIRREYGIEVAQTILGHALGSKIVEVYAEVNLDRAIDVARRIG